MKIHAKPVVNIRDAWSGKYLTVWRIFWLGISFCFKHFSTVEAMLRIARCKEGHPISIMVSVAGLMLTVNTEIKPVWKGLSAPLLSNVMYLLQQSWLGLFSSHPMSM